MKGTGAVGREQVQCEGNTCSGKGTRVKGTGAVGREQVQCEGNRCSVKGTLESLLPFCQSRFEHILNRRKLFNEITELVIIYVYVQFGAKY